MQIYPNFLVRVIFPRYPSIDNIVDNIILFMTQT